MLLLHRGGACALSLQLYQQHFSPQCGPKCQWWTHWICLTLLLHPVLNNSPGLISHRSVQIESLFDVKSKRQGTDNVDFSGVKNILKRTWAVGVLVTEPVLALLIEGVLALVI